MRILWKHHTRATRFYSFENKRALGTVNENVCAYFLFSFSWFRCDFDRGKQASIHTYRMCQSDNNPKDRERERANELCTKYNSVTNTKSIVISYTIACCWRVHRLAFVRIRWLRCAKELSFDLIVGFRCCR